MELMGASAIAKRAHRALPGRSGSEAGLFWRRCPGPAGPRPPRSPLRGVVMLDTQLR